MPVSHNTRASWRQRASSAAVSLPFACFILGYCISLSSSIASQYLLAASLSSLLLSLIFRLPLNRKQRLGQLLLLLVATAATALKSPVFIQWRSCGLKLSIAGGFWLSQKRGASGLAEQLLGSSSGLSRDCLRWLNSACIYFLLLSACISALSIAVLSFEQWLLLNIFGMGVLNSAFVLFCVCMRWRDLQPLRAKLKQKLVDSRARLKDLWQQQLVPLAIHASAACGLGKRAAADKQEAVEEK